MNGVICRLGTAAALAVLLCSAAPQPKNFSNLPLSFEPNHGQGDRAADFFARGAGYGIALRPGAVRVSLAPKSGAKPQNLDLHFKGASRTAKPVAAAELPGKISYLVGADKRNWHTGIPTYARVEYPAAYPGIDLIFYGQQQQLEFDFRVHPGANPSIIRLAASVKPTLLGSGELRIGELRQLKPVAYQINAANERSLVACSYRILPGGDIAFNLGAYDRSRELIIDPVLTYATYLGGTGNEMIVGAKVDSAGNLYVAGSTTSNAFLANSSAQAAYGGANSPLAQARFGDAFVAKLNPAGTALLYATYLGGGGDDLTTALAVDGAGNAYVAGATQSANFPVSTAAYQRTYRGFSGDNFVYNTGDGFVAKLNPAGTALVYSTFLGGALNDLPLGIAVDSSGNAVVVGGTQSTDFPTTENAISRTFRGNANMGPSVAGDGFVTILNAAGTALNYSTFFGGRSKDAIAGVALDAQSNIYLCGLTFSGDFPVTQGAYQTTFRGLETVSNYQGAAGDAFVAKLTAQGAAVYATYLGGSFREGATSIAVDGTGAAYVTGNTASANFPATAGALQSSFGGARGAGTSGETYYGDAFAAKLNPAGSQLVYATYLGGRGDEGGLGLALDSTGSAYITGFSTSTDFPTSADALQKTNAGLGGQGLDAMPTFDVPERARNTGDAFLVKLSPTGALSYSSFFGGSRDDAGIGITADASGNVFIVGNTLSTAAIATGGVTQTAYGGTLSAFPRGDGFVAKFAFGTIAPPPVPTRVNVVAGFTATGPVGTTLAVPFTVEVVDAQGAPVSGVRVTFAAASATVNPATATTGANGRASTTVMLGNTAGSGSVTATVTGLPPATTTLTITTATNPTPAPVVRSFVNGASFQPAVAPGSWVTAFIDQTIPATVTASTVPLPVVLGGIRVLVNGNPIPIYVAVPTSPGTQINAQLPYEIAQGGAQVVVERNGVASAPFAITVGGEAPGIFTFGDNRAVVQNVHADGALTVNTADNPIRAGGVVIAYFTGQGALDNPVPTGGVASGNLLSIPLRPATARLGNTPVDILFIGMTPGQIALGQANLAIPATLAPGTYPLIITIGGVPSNGPSITVSAPQP
jgi:uncharacterized protein (TIGR03437 family)